MKCPNCGTENPTGAQHCQNCQKELPWPSVFDIYYQTLDETRKNVKSTNRIAIVNMALLVIVLILLVVVVL